MQKKAKSKSKNRFPFLFWFIVLLCFMGALINIKLFYNSFFKAVTKMNEKPIGTITFKYKTAQRKFIDRVVWDRLRQNSPLYNGDTVYTAALSEALITFNDGNLMELSQSTMAQIYINEDNSIFTELSEGSAFIDSSSSERGISLSSSGVSVFVQSGSSLNAKYDSSVNGGGVLLQVIKGSASIEDKEGFSKTIDEGERLTAGNSESYKSSLVVTTPVPDAKILYHTQGTAKVLFKWLTSDDIKGALLLLEIAEDKNFSNIINKMKINDALELSVELEPGVYYWRLAPLDEEKRIKENTAEGRIKILQSLPPELIAPVQNYTYKYRSRLPAVRFIWTESPYASSYNLVIADNPELTNPIFVQKTTLPSSIVSTLENGRYYWQVTPSYSIDKREITVSSKIQEFYIEKSGKLYPPILLLPADDGIVNSDGKIKDINFSWKQTYDAVSYNLKIADNLNFSNPIVNEIVPDNYYLLSEKQKSITDGKWYWSVSQIDNEGNESEFSKIRTFFTVKGNLEQRTIEPIDGYKVASSLVQDTVFTWKKNLPESFITKLQISSDKNFNNLLYDFNVSGLFFKGINLKEGGYWWRLLSNNKESALEISSDPKYFEVLPPLDASVLKQPLNRAVAKEDEPFEFSWNKVEGADFYKFAIYKITDNSLVYSETVYGDSIKVDLYDSGFQDKLLYRWEIQAQSSGTPGVISRRTGRIAENDFTLIKLKPVEIIYPSKNQVIDGIEAILNPPYVRWKAADVLSKAKFVLIRTDVSPNKIILKVPKDKAFMSGNKIAPEKIKLNMEEGLKPGKYEIIVYAETIDGIDISNNEKKYRGKFSVSSIKPLPAVSGLKAEPSKIDEEYLKDISNSRVLTLKWDVLKSANEYIVQIKDKKGNLISKETSIENSYKIDLIDLFNKSKKNISHGTFSCIVEGIRLIDSDHDGKLDKVLQKGIPAKVIFEIDIPVTHKSTVKGAVNPYGN